MRCKSVRNSLARSSASNNLSRIQQIRIERHCRACRECVAYRNTIEAIQVQLALSASATPSADLRARVLGAMQSEAGSSPMIGHEGLSPLGKRLKSREEATKMRLMIGVATILVVQTASALTGYFSRHPEPPAKIRTAIPKWQHNLFLKVVECKVSAVDGKVTETVLSSPTLSTLDGMQAAIEINGPVDPKAQQPSSLSLKVSVMPKRIDSNSSSIKADMTIHRKALLAPELKLSDSRRLSLPVTQKTRVLGMTSDATPRVQQFVKSGKMEKADHDYVAYYLDVTDSVLPYVEAKAKK